MTRDYYADSFEVAERLREAGQVVWSEQIAAAIDEGYTASEILMGLRYWLVKLLDEEPPSLSRLWS